MWLSIGTLGVTLAWVILLAASISADSSRMDSAPADAAIVLGAAVWNDRPSPVFEERIKHAVDLYRSGQVRVLIFTGGVGQGDLVAESEVARRYALAAGVKAVVIFCETTSKTTYENLTGARSIVDQQHLGRVILVSDPLHMKRALTMARDLGLEAYPSPTPTTRYISLGSRAGFLAREVYFYTTYLLRRAVGLGGE